MVGVLNTLVDYGVFSLLVFAFGVPVLVAQPLSVAAGIANSFVWNSRWTFGARRSAAWRREVVVFLGVSVIGLLISWAGFAALHLLIGSSATLALYLEKLVASVVSMVWNFIGYRFLAFRAHRKGEAV